MLLFLYETEQIGEKLNYLNYDKSSSKVSYNPKLYNID